jgi:hypothetical protein
MARGAKPRVRVEGAKEVRRALDAMGADLSDLTDLNRKAAGIVAEAAQDIAPVLTGRLRGSIRVRAAKSKGWVYAGKKALPYVGPVHFGWPAHGIEANPFLFDAADMETESVVRVYNIGIGEIVDRAKLRMRVTARG